MLLDTGRILITIKKMADLEAAIGIFYQACAEQWAEDRDFWSALAQMEYRHRDYLNRIAEILLSGSGNFEVGRFFADAAIDTSIAGMRSNIEKLKRGDLKKLQTLYIARDIENSLLESRYSEILKTEDLNYNRMITEIVSQTSEHQKLVLKKIESSRAGS